MKRFRYNWNMAKLSGLLAIAALGGGNSQDSPAYSVDAPGSLWWVVNKQRPLPEGYLPTDLAVPSVPLSRDHGAETMQLSSQIIPALEALFRAADQNGIKLWLISGYRSNAYQQTLYQRYVARDGQAAADRYSARPGTSEHQTGLALDIGNPNGPCLLQTCYEQTPAGTWLAAHAHEYGFILRYPEGKEEITGYQYEPWHFRYVGLELAHELHQSGQTMEEYFALK